MALATRKSGDIHNKTGDKLAQMKSKFDNGKHLDYAVFEEFGALMYQIQLLREDIDELRRYITSSELLLPNKIGDSLPGVDPRSSGQLWNNKGILAVSKG